MTKEQAGHVLGVLNAGFPRDALEEPSALLWLSEVGMLSDYQVALETAHQIVREGDRFPLVKEFRWTYHAVNARHREATQKLPEAARSTEVPEWVQVWWWDRLNHGQEQWRPFPQQPHVTGTCLTTAEYEQKREGWVSAGSPRIRNARDIVRSIA